jgi:iron complex transport system permease protein
MSCVLLLALVLGCAIGAVAIAPSREFALFVQALGWSQPAPGESGVDATILFQVRLPRVIAGALVGAALATAGALLQGMLGNPLADPYLIGMSGGAAFGATIAVLISRADLTFAGFGLTPLLACGGGLLTVTLVYRLARVGGTVPVTNLLLAGVAVSSLLVACTTLLITVSGRLAEHLQELFSWLSGGIAVAGWSQIALAGPILVLALIGSWTFAGALNAFALGEEAASYVGVDVDRQKVAIVVLSAVLTGLSVTLSGLVGFVGLMAPHAMRMAFGPDHRLLLPASALCGASFLVLADMGARTVLAPTELPVGVVTALLGGRFFLWLLQRSRRTDVY